MAFVRVRGQTQICGLPNGGNDARAQCALQKMELAIAMMGGQWRVFSGPEYEEHSLGFSRVPKRRHRRSAMWLMVTTSPTCSYKLLRGEHI